MSEWIKYIGITRLPIELSFLSGPRPIIGCTGLQTPWSRRVLRFRWCLARPTLFSPIPPGLNHAIESTTALEFINQSIYLIVNYFLDFLMSLYVHKLQTKEYQSIGLKPRQIMFVPLGEPCPTAGQPAVCSTPDMWCAQRTPLDFVIMESILYIQCRESPMYHTYLWWARLLYTFGYHLRHRHWGTGKPASIQKSWKEIADFFVCWSLTE